MSPLYRPPAEKLRAQGKRANRRAAFEAQAVRAVKQRIGSRPVCEGCGQGGVELDGDHVFGRAGTGAGLGWPWCDLPELRAAVCRDCHTAMTDGQEQETRLRLRICGAQRFMDRGVLEGWLTGRRRIPDDAASLPGFMRRLVIEADQMQGRDIVLGTNREGDTA